jgi:site-specific DNA-cytosine methylase
VVIVSSAHLCAGYDGLGMALTRAGIEHDPVWLYENEPDASRVLERTVPVAHNFGDLLEIDEHGELPEVDLLTGGLPCQPVSVQGKRQGKADKRYLWPYGRKAIQRARPFRVFLENVGNLVTIEGGRLHDEILSDLRADGYAVRWLITGACMVGAAHHRHRWFLVADYVGAGAPPAERVDVQKCGFSLKQGRLLPSPRAGDEKRGIEPDRAARTGTGPTLNDAVGNLTPGTWGIYTAAIDRHEGTMGISPPRPLVDGRLSGAFVEWLMMLPPRHISWLPRQDAVRLGGNGVVPDQARFAYQMLTRD